MSYNLGLVSISFRKNSAEEILDAMKKAGLTHIEWGSDVHAPKDDEANLDRIVKLQKEYGITCSSYGTYFRLGVTPISELEGYIKAAKVLGTHVLRLWCSDKDSENHTDEEKAELFNQCKTAAKIAENQGVKLCMECHNNTYTNTKEAALELMQEVNSPNFGMYWQPNQYRTEDENVRYATLLKDYTEHLHVFNWEGSEKFPLAGGAKIWKRYLACFGDNKTLLLEFMPDNKIESLVTEVAALKEIAGVK